MGEELRIFSVHLITAYSLNVYMVNPTKWTHFGVLSATVGVTLQCITLFSKYLKLMDYILSYVRQRSCNNFVLQKTLIYNIYPRIMI